MATKSREKSQRVLKFTFASRRLCARHLIFECSFVVSFCAFSWPFCGAAQAFTFDDVDFWVGSGANRAAMAIDWVENSTEQPALVWGYRWDGEAFGRDMLRAIVEADDRLYVKFGGAVSNPVAVYGLGYDNDNDGNFGIDDGTEFDNGGVAFGTAPFFPAATINSSDYYAEGWIFGFWHIGVPAQAGTNPFDGGNWTSSNFGMASYKLTDGDWNGWAFTNSTAFPYTAYPENPVAALTPFPPGDFDHDFEITAADYDVWKANFGSTTELAADANGNRVIDAADYTIWRNNFNSGGASNAPLIVPEPSSISAVAAALLFLFIHTLRARRLAF